MKWISSLSFYTTKVCKSSIFRTKKLVKVLLSDTPNEYEPPNFKSANQPFGLMSTNYFAIGKVDTGFHKVTTHGTGKNVI